MTSLQEEIRKNKREYASYLERYHLIKKHCVSLAATLAFAFLIGTVYGAIMTHNAVHDITTQCYVETHSTHPDPKWIGICAEQEFKLNH